MGNPAQLESPPPVKPARDLSATRHCTAWPEEAPASTDILLHVCRVGRDRPACAKTAGLVRNAI